MGVMRNEAVAVHCDNNSGATNKSAGTESVTIFQDCCPPSLTVGWRTIARPSWTNYIK